MTPQQFDLQQTALHEAAHTIIAQHYGMPTRKPVIQFNPNGGIEERHYLGQAFIDLRQASEKHIALMGMAGEGIHFYMEDADPYECPEYWEWDQESYSDSDKQSAGNYWEDPQVWIELFATFDKTITQIKDLAKSIKPI